MASRKLSDWVDSYMDFTENTEPARIYQKWVGLSVIAAVLRKKVQLSLGRIRIYPNMYVVLVGEPGIARKSQSINFGLDLLSNIPDIKTSADAITPQALIQDMESAVDSCELPEGEVLTHSSMTIISREFESFLGQKQENTKMLVLLTDLFDCQELPWKYRTKGSGDNIIPSLFLNLLGATTPDSLASCLPSTAVGGGLTSRIIFVWADRKHKKVTKPEMTKEERILKESLIQDLYLIARIAGTYEFSKEADANWDSWYTNYDEQATNRLCQDPSFNGWYSRKPMYLLKLSILMAASQSDKRIIEWKHIEKAMKTLAEAEVLMGNVFKAIGKSTVTVETDIVTRIVQSAGWITEKQLLSMVWRDMDAKKFDNVVSTAMRSGKIKRSFIGPKQEKGEIWYLDAKLRPPTSLN